MSLSNIQFHKIIREYEQTQIKNQHTTNARLEAVLALEPRIHEIHKAISQQSISCAKKLIAGEEEAIAGLQASLNNLRKEHDDLLKKHGYPLNYLDPIYNCKDCKDTGFVNNRKCH